MTTATVPSPLPAGELAPSALPLAGVRVVTFTTGIAGPYASRILASLGADVIKVESRHGGLDSFRFFPAPSGSLDDDVNLDPLDLSSRFAEFNLGVRSVTLDLKQPAGREVVRRLIGASDGVVENFRPDVLPRLGVHPTRLVEEHPDLVVVRLNGMGTFGPRSSYGTWGPTVLGYSGFLQMWDHPGHDVPVGAQAVYPDYLSAVVAATAFVAGLLRVRQGGGGGVMEIAQTELAAYALGGLYTEVLDHDVDPLPIGNTSELHAPHGLYRCAGEDEWCAVSVVDDTQWLGLQGLLADDLVAELGEDLDGLRTREGRLARRDALDRALGAWTSRRGSRAVMTELQAHGVPAGAVQNGRDLVDCPHLTARGFVGRVPQPGLGRLAVPRMPLTFDGARLAESRAALLGEHTEEVLRGVLGYDDDALRELAEAGVLS